MTLTPALHQVAALHAAGLPAWEIARRLGVSLEAVQLRMRRLRDLFGTDDRRRIAEALPACTIGMSWRRGRQNHRRGDPVQITGGAYAGSTGEFIRVVNSVQSQVGVRNGAVTVKSEFLSGMA